MLYDDAIIIKYSDKGNPMFIPRFLVLLALGPFSLQMTYGAESGSVSDGSCSELGADIAQWKGGAKRTSPALTGSGALARDALRAARSEIFTQHVKGPAQNNLSFFVNRLIDEGVLQENISKAVEDALGTDERSELAKALIGFVQALSASGIYQDQLKSTPCSNYFAHYAWLNRSIVNDSPGRQPLPASFPVGDLNEIPSHPPPLSYGHEPIRSRARVSRKSIAEMLRAPACPGVLLKDVFSLVENALEKGDVDIERWLKDASLEVKNNNNVTGSVRYCAELSKLVAESSVDEK